VWNAKDRKSPISDESSKRFNLHEFVWYPPVKNVAITFEVVTQEWIRIEAAKHSVFGTVSIDIIVGLNHVLPTSGTAHKR
jgi:hypothetical protein